MHNKYILYINKILYMHNKYILYINKIWDYEREERWEEQYIFIFILLVWWKKFSQIYLRINLNKQKS